VPAAFGRVNAAIEITDSKYSAAAAEYLSRARLASKLFRSVL